VFTLPSRSKSGLIVLSLAALPLIGCGASQDGGGKDPLACAQAGAYKSDYFRLNQELRVARLDASEFRAAQAQVNQARTLWRAAEASCSAGD